MRFDDIDLSRLPAPAALTRLDYEAVLAAILASFAAAWEVERARRPDLPAYDTLHLESDPVRILLQVVAYRELLLIGRVNDSWKASRLAYASGTDLDNIAGEFGVRRKLIDPGDPLAAPPVPEAYEHDDDLRRRAQLFAERLTTAGNYGGYYGHALSADDQVLDAAVFGPEAAGVEPGQVLVVVQSAAEDGETGEDLVAAVLAYLNAEDRRPLTDQVLVEAAELETYAIEAVVKVRSGASAEAVRAEAEAAVRAYVADRRRIGDPIRRSALAAALYVQDDTGRSPVEDIVITAPAVDVDPGARGFAVCTGVEITAEVIA